MKVLKCIICILFFGEGYLLSSNPLKVEFVIKNKFIQDSSYVNLLVKNNTSTSYYLPIIESPETEKWKFVVRGEEGKFFFLEKTYSDSIKNNMPLYSDDCITGGNEEQFDFETLWDARKSKISVDDIVCLRPGDSATLKIPIHLIVKLADYCKWQIQGYNYKSNIWLVLRYEYKVKPDEFLSLSANTINELHRRGFSLYTDEIISNRVKVIPSKYYYPDLIRQQKADSAQKAYTIARLERIKKHKELPKGSLQEKYYYYCCPDLSKLKRSEKYTFYKTENICSIRESISAACLIGMEKLGYDRLKEIAGFFFKKRIYLHLIAGVGSVDFAEVQNKNIKDDHRLIYVSVDDCLDIQEIKKAVDVYNRETKRLMGW
jgi:hypothetical protein